MSKEAGQVAYETYCEALDLETRGAFAWAHIHPEHKAAYAAAEQAAAAKAWDEGYEACLYDTNTGQTKNPYRPEPAKGDGNGE